MPFRIQSTACPDAHFPTLSRPRPAKDYPRRWSTNYMARSILPSRYLLVYQVGEFNLRRIPDVLVLGAGGLLLAITLSRALGNFQKDQ